MKKIALLIIVALCSVSLYSQVETHYYQKGDTIHSDFRKIKGLGCNTITKMPEFDLQELIEEDKRTEDTNSPYRFGKAFDVSYNLSDGTWTNVENGRLWTMSFLSEGALSLNFVFDDFHLPEGAELYIENQKETVLYGPVTTKDIPKSGFFLTDIIPGNQVKIYIFEPSDVKGTSSLTIRRVVHGYRGNLTSDPYGNVGGSESCHIDVACEPSYAEESNAVALVLLSGGSHWCSGSLQMSTDFSFKPYFLTAFHCADSNLNNALSSSEIANAEAWMFKFFFKKTTCGGTDYTGTTYNSATFRAAYAFTDFLLMEINHNLKQNTSLTWLGWDKSGNVPSSGVCIQHPNGDLMKIAISDNSAITSSFNGYSNNGWRMRWNSDGGVTQKGSSGSPLLNQNKKVVGQVYGKKQEDINESNEICGRKNTHFGKFNISWTGGGTNSTRLSNWLDPIGTNLSTINSYHPIIIAGDDIICSYKNYYIQNLPSGASVQWSVSNSNLSIISGQGTGSATFQKNSNGACVISAQVSIGTLTPTFTKNVWAGTPTAPSISGWPNTNLFLANSQYMLYANVDSQAQVTEYQWDVVRGATITSGGNTDSPIFTMNSSGSVRIGVRARNACGWGPYTYMNGGITNDNGQTPINSPGNNIVNIPLPEEGEYEIMLWNTNRLIRTVKTSQSSYDVDLNGLPSDLYIIKVMKDGQSIYQLKVKK
jgi:hypothetical protein